MFLCANIKLLKNNQGQSIIPIHIPPFYNPGLSCFLQKQLLLLSLHMHVCPWTHTCSILNLLFCLLVFRGDHLVRMSMNTYTQHIESITLFVCVYRWSLEDRYTIRGLSQFHKLTQWKSIYFQLPITKSPFYAISFCTILLNKCPHNSMDSLPM